MGVLVRFCLLAMLVVLAGRASAQEPPHVRWTFTRSPAASSCPDGGDLQLLVAARLGYQAFDASARDEMSVQLDRRAGRFAASLELRGPQGEVLGARQLESAQPTCDALVADVVLAITIAVDPLGIGRNAATQQQPTPPLATPAPAAAPIAVAPIAAAPPQPAPPPTAPPPERATRAAARASAGLHVATGSVPSLTFGIDASVGLRWPSFSLSLEGRVDLPGSERVSTGEVQGSLLAATLAPCVHVDVFSACALLTLGALDATSSGLPSPESATTIFAGVGARAAAELRIAPLWLVRPRLDLLAALSRTTLLVDEQPAWKTPPLSMAFGVDIVLDAS